MVTDSANLLRIVDGLRDQPREAATVEFMMNWKLPRDIGEYISALGNVAALERHDRAWLVSHSGRFAQTRGVEYLDLLATELAENRYRRTAGSFARTGYSTINPATFMRTANRVWPAPAHDRKAAPACAAPCR